MSRPDALSPPPRPQSTSKPKRKSKKQSSKLKSVPLSDGWTKITRGPPASSVQLPSPLPGTSPEKDLEALTARYAKYETTWRASSSRTRLAEQISSLLSGSEKSKVTKAICLCLGSPSAFGEAGQRAISQLVVFDDLVSFLNAHLKDDKDGDVKVKSFMQEPLLTATDKTFITSKGHVVLEVPDVLQHIDSTTLVFIPCGEKSVIAEMLKKAFPAIYIGNELDAWIDFAKEGEADPILKRFRESRTFEKFPRFNLANWTDVMVIG